MDEQRYDQTKLKKTYQTNNQHQLQAHNMPTDEENAKGRNLEGYSQFNKPRTVPRRTKNMAERNKRNIEHLQ